MHLLSSIGFVFCVAYVSAASVADRFDLTPRIIGTSYFLFVENTCFGQIFIDK